MLPIPPERALAMCYAQVVDNRDFSAMRDIIADNFCQQGPSWSCQGADAFVDQLQYLTQNYSATMHFVGNQVGKWDGGSYEGVTYCLASHIYEKEGAGRKLDMAIRYNEGIEKMGENYHYTQRDVDIVWTSDQPLNIG